MSKKSLTPDHIVAKALEFTQEHDVNALSFRRLAETLDVSAMAIYRHFESKQDLLIAMLDEFINQANVLPDSDVSLGWANWIEHVALKMYGALIEQPSWLPLLGQLPLQNSGLQVLNACLEQLQQSGFSQEQAVDAFFAMLQVLFGAAICQQQLQSTKVINTSKPYPYIDEAMETIIVNMQRNQIDLGLRILIAGLRNERST